MSAAIPVEVAIDEPPPIARDGWTVSVFRGLRDGVQKKWIRCDRLADGLSFDNEYEEDAKGAGGDGFAAPVGDDVMWQLMLNHASHCMVEYDRIYPVIRDEAAS